MEKNSSWIYKDILHDPDRLLDTVIAHPQLKNDAALAKTMGLTHSALSKSRHHRLPLGTTRLLRIMEVTDFSLRRLQEILR